MISHTLLGLLYLPKKMAIMQGTKSGSGKKKRKEKIFGKKTVSVLNQH